MDVFCITSSNPQFQKLLAESGEKQGVFTMMVSKWMTESGIHNRYPTLQELGITAMESVKPGVEELFDSNPKLANQVYEALGFKKDLSYDIFKKIIRPKGYAWSILEGGKKVTVGNKEFNFNIATGNNIGQAIQWVIDNNGSKKEVLSIIEVFLKEYQNKSPENYKPLDYIIKEAIEDGNFFQKLKEGYISLNDIAKNNAKRTFDNLLELYYEVHSGNIADIETDVEENSKNTGYEFLDDRLDYYSGLSQQQKQQALQQYSQYLDTIFPNSKVKDIVYHGTDAQFDKFDKTKAGLKTGWGKEYSGIFFFNNTQASKGYAINIKYGVIAERLDRATIEDHGGWEEFKEDRNFGSIIEEAKIAYKEETGKIAKEDYLFEEFLLGWTRMKAKESGNIYSVLLNIKNPLIEDSKGRRFVQHVKDTYKKISKENDGIIVENTLDQLNDQIGFENTVSIVFEPEQIHILGSKKDIEGFKEFVGNVEDKASESGLSLSTDEAAAYNSLVSNGTIPIKCK